MEGFVKENVLRQQKRTREAEEVDLSMKHDMIFPALHQFSQPKIGNNVQQCCTAHSALSLAHTVFIIFLLATLPSFPLWSARSF